jgi:primary-amine oxidase
MNISVGCGETSAVQGALHPLEPLTADEIRRVVAIIKASDASGPSMLFETIELKEPGKGVYKAHETGAPVPREARANVFRGDRVGVRKYLVSLDADAILSVEERPDAKPMIQLEQFLEAEAIARTSPEFIAACAKRGVTDMSQVCVDPWSAGNFGKPDEEGRHVLHTFAWLRLRPDENFYAHPIEGLNAVFDLSTKEVIRVDDYGVVPIPMQEVNYASQFQTETRDLLKPLNVVQPEGVSFNLQGRHITWHKWSLVIGFNGRESLTLHDIRYDGRPVVHRASLVEMVVPYGSPDSGHYRKNVFDIGEYGLGKLANSLQLGCDCLGAIAYLDAHLNAIDGEVVTIPQAICIHEEDHGLLWKHWDFRTNKTESRRARKLVISAIATVGNYEYAQYWYLHMDGAIEFEMKATGIVNTAACPPGQPGKYAAEVSPGVVGHIHQHIFCARLDMAIDGDRNSVVECNTYAEPLGPGNPHGNAFYEEETLLATEQQACRKANLASQRSWKVINPSSKNHVGKPVGYKLDPRHCVTPFVHPDSPSGSRSRFVENHLWVTAFDPEERYAAGEFMNRSSGAGDIADFVKKDRALENADVVLWHVFGLHHPVRPEDFPVQSCISTGFRLMPSGFFDHNPCLDLPPAANAASCHAHGAE